MAPTQPRPPSAIVRYLRERAIEWHREDDSHTYEALAKRAGIGKSTLSTLVSATVGLGRRESQDGLARALGIDLGTLAHEAEEWARKRDLDEMTTGNPATSVSVPADMDRAFPNLAAALNAVDARVPVPALVRQRASRMALEGGVDLDLGTWCSVVEQLARSLDAGHAVRDTGPLVVLRRTR